MIVDIGTGTGRWAIEMAARYPGATIIGVDIAPIQAKPVPENVRFEIADVEKPWTIDPSSVDFIHVRALAGMIRNWPSLISEAFGKLKPGGLLEITDVRGRVLDFDGKFGEDEITPNLTRLFQQLATSLGTIFDPAPEMPGWLHDEGFEKVAQQTEIIPLGRWAKDKKLRARQKQATAMVLPWFRTFTCPFGMIQSVSAGFPPGSHTHSIRKHGEADPQKENHATNLSANHEEVRADTDAEIERVIRDISDANVKTYVQAYETRPVSSLPAILTDRPSAFSRLQGNLVKNNEDIRLECINQC